MSIEAVDIPDSQIHIGFSLKIHTGAFDGRRAIRAHFLLFFDVRHDFYRTISLKASAIKMLGLTYVCIFSKRAYRYEFGCKTGVLKRSTDIENFGLRQD